MKESISVSVQWHIALGLRMEGRCRRIADRRCVGGLGSERSLECLLPYVASNARKVLGAHWSGRLSRFFRLYVRLATSRSPPSCGTANSSFGGCNRVHLRRPAGDPGAEYLSQVLRAEDSGIPAGNHVRCDDCSSTRCGRHLRRSTPDSARAQGAARGSNDPMELHDGSQHHLRRPFNSVAGSVFQNGRRSDDSNDESACAPSSRSLP